MIQSQSLTKFYREYLAWVEQGALEHATFDRNSGLCMQLDRYAERHSLCRTSMLNELEDQFYTNDLSHVLPFNDRHNDLHDQYVDECRKKQCHLNQFRIQWVRDHIED